MTGRVAGRVGLLDGSTAIGVHGVKMANIISPNRAPSESRNSYRLDPNRKFHHHDRLRLMLIHFGFQIYGMCSLLQRYHEFRIITELLSLSLRSLLYQRKYSVVSEPISRYTTAQGLLLFLADLFFQLLFLCIPISNKLSADLLNKYLYQTIFGHWCVGIVE